MNVKSLKKVECLEKLEPIVFNEKTFSEEGRLEQMSLASALLALADITHDREHALCRDIAEHLLGKVPEPDDADLEED